MISDQTYLQSLTLRLEEMRVKRRDTEQWMRHRNLTPEIVNRVRRYDQYKWVATRGVDEEDLLQSLPSDLRRDIKRQLCLELVRKVRSQNLETHIFVSFGFVNLLSCNVSLSFNAINCKVRWCH